MNKLTIFKKTVKLINSNKVFEPNLTTQAILEVKFNNSSDFRSI